MGEKFNSLETDEQVEAVGWKAHLNVGPSSKESPGAIDAELEAIAGDPERVKEAVEEHKGHRARILEENQRSSAEIKDMFTKR